MPKKKSKSPAGWLAKIKYDIYAIILCSLGAALVVVVLSGSNGFLGGYINTGLKYAFGSGRFLFPWFLVAWGIGIWRGYDFRIVTPAGLALSFLSFLSIVSLSFPAGSFPDKEFAFSYGGYTGSTVSWLLSSLVGKTASYILFAGMGLSGLIITTNKTINEIAGYVKKLFSENVETETGAATKAIKNRGESVKVNHHTSVTESAGTPFELAQEPLAGDEKSSEDVTVMLKSPQSNGKYVLPPKDLLRMSSLTATKSDITDQIEALEKTIRDFDVDAKVVQATQGPTVTLYEIQLGSGVKVNRISNLEPDIALALATPDIRILAPIPGKSAVGIEVPNNRRELVTLGDVLRSPDAGKHDKNLLDVALGKDISGHCRFADIATMPHLLIAGATGSGKSVAVNCLILSVLMKAPPEEVKFLLIDPKLVELSTYNNIPHLLTPVVSNPKKASAALAWAVSEMEERYQRLFDLGAKNIAGYNELAKNKKDVEKMPYILIVIDELADLMMTSASDVEAAICRIAQKARAVGIHLVVATQRPSVDVITGLIKANITSRIAFAVSSQHDSRVIVDSVGAEKLVGRGDMLYMSPSTLKPERIQGSYVSEQEIEPIVDFIKRQAEPSYLSEIFATYKSAEGGIGVSDPLWEDAVEIILNGGQASVSMFQRRLGIGYTRAGRLMDILEEKGMVGAYEGSKPRQVLITREAWEEMRAVSNNNETG